ncbi:MAG: FAD:protein FMN transferase [Acidimicrobiia bacterium]
MLTTWVEHQFRAMGSPSHLLLGDAPDSLVQWAVDEIERLEQCWSRFRSDSELNVLNDSSGGGAEISPTMRDILLRARRLWTSTSGRFDPTVIDALERLGYDRPFLEVDRQRPEAAPSTIPVPSFGGVMIDPARLRVLLPAGTRLDLGGIGKGLAADIVTEGLADRGARHVCLALGGDVRVAGDPPVDGWRIPVEDPFTDATLFEWPMTSGAIVTSTTRFRRWERGGRQLHHIIDPATGQSASGGLTAVITAGTEAWWAEGIAKAALIAGPTEGADLIRRHALQGWLAYDDGRIEKVTA